MCEQKLRLCSTPGHESRAGTNQYDHYEYGFAPRCASSAPEQDSRAGANQYDHYEYGSAPLRASSAERRAANAERKRRSREQMSGEETEARRAADAERQRRSREQMNEAEIERLRAANADRQRRSREQMDEAAIETLPAAHAERQRRSREQMNEAAIETLRAANAERQQRPRERMNEAEIETLRAANAERQRRSRGQMSETEIEVRRAANAERQRRARSNISREESGRGVDSEWQQRLRPRLDGAGTASRGSNAGPHRTVPRNATGLARSPRERSQSNTLGNMDQVCRGCGALHFPGEKTTPNSTVYNMCCNLGKVSMNVFENFPVLLQQDSDFSGEKITPNSTVYNMCCNLGKVSMNVFENFPVLLQQLYTGTGSESIQFLKHIRNYNNSLAMASTTAQLENPRGEGPYCFKVHGQIYHRIGALPPLAGNAPQCAQMLIMNTEEAAAELAGRDVNRERDRATFAVLHQLLQTINPYVQASRLMDAVAREEEQRAIEAQRTQRPVRMVFCQYNTDDLRRYNIATANEVAVVYVGNNEEIPGERYVISFMNVAKGCEPSAT
ncbi:unnamed protein product [Heligmosomoides polygyrus]|uniref:Helitron_like_N domain-containing protein n=1 Tax=Heligmosomoides polygyrus TaxID=6339 RepID=A0A183G416_HELPZ|nr:unnamed protein product [Heligmosomoides polygyrus]